MGEMKPLEAFVNALVFQYCGTQPNLDSLEEYSWLKKNTT